jgi:hypothetical protein
LRYSRKSDPIDNHLGPEIVKNEVSYWGFSSSAENHGSCK